MIIIVDKVKPTGGGGGNRRDGGGRGEEGGGGENEDGGEMERRGTEGQRGTERNDGEGEVVEEAVEKARWWRRRSNLNKYECDKKKIIIRNSQTL